MKIAIINLTAGGMSGGYRKYLRNVIPRMASNPNVEALLCASPLSLSIQEWFEPLPNVKFANCKTYSLFGLNPDSELVRQLKEFLPDVIFVPTERFFRFKKVPIVNMIQNMEPFVLGIDGNSFTERFRNWVRRMDGKRSFKESDRIIAISKYVRDFLIQHWNIPDDKIGLVYHGADLPENNKIYRPNIIPKGWGGHFLFTAGSIRSARGVEDILWAMRHLVVQDIQLKGLVIAGEAGPRMIAYQDNLRDCIQKHNLSSKVCWAGNLKEEEMTWCYRNCNAFVVTSRVEACPNIALEAMANGCVCISTDNPPMPEIFGDTAYYYQAKDSQSLAENIKRVLGLDETVTNIIREKARKRASQFSWDVCVEKTVAELKKAIETFKQKN